MEIASAGLQAPVSQESARHPTTWRCCPYLAWRRLPVDTYLFPLNTLDRAYPGWEGSDTVAERVRIVQSTPKPFILIKALCAGCIPPGEGIPFVLENAKPNDVLCIGFGSEREAEEIVRMVEKTE